MTNQFKLEQPGDPYILGIHHGFQMTAKVIIHAGMLDTLAIVPGWYLGMLKAEQ